MSLTVADLSPDQRVAFDAIVRWTRAPGGKAVLSLGGYAGCLSGGTMLAYNRGARANTRPISLRDLYLKFNGYAVPGVRGASARFVDLTLPTYLESMWPDGTVALNRVVGVLKSGVKKVIRMTFDDDALLTLTEDHPIAIPGGEFIAAGSLVVGDRVLGRGSMRPVGEGQGRRPIDQRPPRIIVNTKYHPVGAFKAVESNGVTYEYMRVARARLVVEAAMNGIDYDEFVHALKHNEGVSGAFKYLSPEVDVHHVDEDTLNDDITNLEVLPHAEHARIHTTERNATVEYMRERVIVGVSPGGEEMTYDIQMEPPANNFVADGIIVHNTGKSTLVGLVAAELPPPVAFVAFTGKASSVLKRKLSLAGTTTVGAQRPNRDGAPSLEQRPFCGTIHALVYRPCECREPKTVTIARPCPECPKDAPSEVAETTCAAGHKLTAKQVAAIKPRTFHTYPSKVDGKCGVCDDKGWLRRDVLDRPYSLIIVDEASMVDDAMLADLKSYQIPILAVGDHGQLPPVRGVGSLMRAPDLRLEKIHRQAEGNPIILLSKIIRETGSLPDNWRGLDDAAGDERVVFATMRQLPQLLESRYEGAAAARLRAMGLVCATNRRRVGLNVSVRRILGMARTGRELPRKGEHVVCLRNMKGLNGGAPIYNGMRGVCASDLVAKPVVAGMNRAPDMVLTGQIGFPDDEIEPREFDVLRPQFGREKTYQDPDELTRETGFHSFAAAGSLFDFGYAMTCHKMQGSQAEDLVVVAERMGPMSAEDWTRWLYTSCTRAAERLIVVRP